MNFRVHAYAAADELIKLHKSMTEISSDINVALSKALENAADELSQQREFAIAVKAFQKKLMEELDSSSSQAHSYFSALMKSVESAANIVLSSMATSAKDVENDMAGLREVSYAISLLNFENI